MDKHYEPSLVLSKETRKEKKNHDSNKQKKEEDEQCHMQNGSPKSKWTANNTEKHKAAYYKTPMHTCTFMYVCVCV